MLILKTKLFIPASDLSIIDRPRLFAQIDSSKRLTLVSAPAGYGKTTLVANWLKLNPNVRGGWLSLEPFDNDLNRFVTYTIAALQSAYSEIGVSAFAKLKDGLSIETIMIGIINDIVECVPPEKSIILVLDDYHRIENRAIHQAMEYLIDHAPPQFHLICLTRVDPALPLARLRARGQIKELRSTELRFTIAESGRFFKRYDGFAPFFR